MTKLSRLQAVEIVGEADVASVEAVNCEPTGTVGYNGACQGDGSVIDWTVAGYEVI